MQSRDCNRSDSAAPGAVPGWSTSATLARRASTGTVSLEYVAQVFTLTGESCTCLPTTNNIKTPCAETPAVSAVPEMRQWSVPTGGKVSGADAAQSGYLPVRTANGFDERSSIPAAAHRIDRSTRRVVEQRAVNSDCGHGRWCVVKANAKKSPPGRGHPDEPAPGETGTFHPTLRRDPSIQELRRDQGQSRSDLNSA